MSLIKKIVSKFPNRNRNFTIQDFFDGIVGGFFLLFLLYGTLFLLNHFYINYTSNYQPNTFIFESISNSLVPFALFICCFKPASKKNSLDLRFLLKSLLILIFYVIALYVVFALSASDKPLSNDLSILLFFGVLLYFFYVLCFELPKTRIKSSYMN
jgi:hypothetical protein